MNDTCFLIDNCLIADPYLRKQETPHPSIYTPTPVKEYVLSEPEQYLQRFREEKRLKHHSLENVAATDNDRMSSAEGLQTTAGLSKDDYLVLQEKIRQLQEELEQTRAECVKAKNKLQRSTAEASVNTEQIESSHMKKPSCRTIGSQTEPRFQSDGKKIVHLFLQRDSI